MKVNVKVRTTYQKFSVKKHGRMYLKQAYFGEFGVKKSQPVSGKSQQRGKQVLRPKARWRGQVRPIPKESQEGLRSWNKGGRGRAVAGLPDDSLHFILSGMKSHQRILKRRVRQSDLQYKKYTKHSKQPAIISYRSKRIISFPFTWNTYTIKIKFWYLESYLNLNKREFSVTQNLLCSNMAMKAWP